MRKHLLLDDINNLYSKFIDSYPNHKIGRSNFFSLRPNWLLPVQAQSQEVCKCIYHENIDLVCTALANFSRSKQTQIDLKSFASADNLVKTTVCDIFDKNCVWRSCGNCSINNIYKLFEPLQTFYNDQITIYQWERVLLEKEGNSLKVTKKAPQSKCIDEVINILENQLQSFSIYQHTKIVQLHLFKHQKENLSDSEVIISGDFSKNYSLKHQNEIMSAHYTW